MIKTTAMKSMFDGPQDVLTGKEQYPVLGATVPMECIDSIQSLLKGRLRYWDCLPKAEIAAMEAVQHDCHQHFTVVVGAMMVFSNEGNGSYGFYYNPPFEFHAWVEMRPSMHILDVALPGVIEQGLQTSDAEGTILQGRTPAILNGAPPTWLHYLKVREIG